MIQHVSLADVPADSYPGKLNAVLYIVVLKNSEKKPEKDLLFLSCELIDDNGKELEKCVLKYAEQWNLV
ncbi:MAG: hypothetical protein ACLTZM_23115 [Ruminococcus sp.]